MKNNKYEITTQQLQVMQDNWNQAFSAELDHLRSCIRNQKTPEVQQAEHNGIRIMTVKMSTIAGTPGFVLSAGYYSADKQAAAVYQALKDCKTPMQVKNAVKIMLQREAVYKNSELVCRLNEQTLRILKESAFAEKKNTNHGGICPLCGHSVLTYDVARTDDELHENWSCPQCQATGMAVYKPAFEAHVNVMDGKGSAMPNYIKEGK